jgi:hypothetical protein
MPGKLCGRDEVAGWRSNLTDQQYSGVWLSDVSDEQQGGVLLEVNIDLTEEQLAQYEWVEEEKNFYREWLIPAAVVNSKAVVQIAEEQE